MSILIYNYSVTGDCSNTGSGAVSFDITGSTPTVSPFSISDATGQGLLPLSAATNTFIFQQALQQLLIRPIPLVDRIMEP
jgi:hypothetical protein